MEHKKYLFLCECGEKRSPTCASVALEVFGDSHLEFTYGAYSVVRSSGKKVLPYLNSFGAIIVMEDYMRKGLVDLGVRTRLFCLDIPEGNERNSPELRKLARERLELIFRQLR